MNYFSAIHLNKIKSKLKIFLCLLYEAYFTEHCTYCHLYGII